jgi:cellulose synthase/poly-beta-1,6-N-acetylglucosamine synthase-like glycosyltransferase
MCIVYLASLSLLALIAPRTGVKPASRLRRFAVVVPAHNEELSLAKTVRSLLRIGYPRSHFTVIVVADNCTDRTADIGRSEGALVLERTHPALRSKGHALRWCFDILLPERPAYDAVVVIDADSVVSENFLSVMNGYLDQGSSAVQCNDMAEPRPEAWSSEITRLGFTLYNYVRPMGRRLLGASAGIRGNGMCFTTDLLRRVPWSTYSLTEDLEYGLILLLNGVTVDFAPEAIALAAMPANVRNAETQRARWERGRLPVIRMYSTKLLVEAMRRRSFAMLDAFIDLVIPPFVNLFGIVMAGLVFNVVLWQCGFLGTSLFPMIWFALFILGIVHVVAGLVAAKADRNLYKALFSIPRYAVWKASLYLRMALRKGTKREWIRTTREQIAFSEHQKNSK